MAALLRLASVPLPDLRRLLEEEAAAGGLEEGEAAAAAAAAAAGNGVNGTDAAASAAAAEHGSVARAIQLLLTGGVGAAQFTLPDELQQRAHQLPGRSSSSGGGALASSSSGSGPIGRQSFHRLLQQLVGDREALAQCKQEMLQEIPQFKLVFDRVGVAPEDAPTVSARLAVPALVCTSLPVACTHRRPVSRCHVCCSRARGLLAASAWAGQRYHCTVCACGACCTQVAGNASLALLCLLGLQLPPDYTMTDLDLPPSVEAILPTKLYRDIVLKDFDGGLGCRAQCAALQYHGSAARGAEGHGCTWAGLHLCAGEVLPCNCLPHVLLAAAASFTKQAPIHMARLLVLRAPLCLQCSGARCGAQRYLTTSGRWGQAERAAGQRSAAEGSTTSCTP